MAWFMRGVQSAIFYYVSCAPIYEWKARRTMAKQNERYKKEMDALEKEMPDMYRQPDPYQTNEYWAEEIQAGPGPPKKRLNKRMQKKHQLLMRSFALRQNRSSQSTPELSPPNTPSLDSRPATAPEDTDRDEQDRADSKPNIKGMKRKLKDAAIARNLPGTERWRTFQRQDEELWGLGKGQQTNQSSSAFDRPSTDQTSTYSHLTNNPLYDKPRIPHLSELHPPVVSNPPPSVAATRWMLQPPPSAAVMAGLDEAPSGTITSQGRSRASTANSKTLYQPATLTSSPPRATQQILSSTLDGPHDTDPATHPSFSSGAVAPDALAPPAAAVIARPHSRKSQHSHYSGRRQQIDPEWAAIEARYMADRPAELEPESRTADDATATATATATEAGNPAEAAPRTDQETVSSKKPATRKLTVVQRTYEMSRGPSQRAARWRARRRQEKESQEQEERDREAQRRERHVARTRERYRLRQKQAEEAREDPAAGYGAPDGGSAGPGRVGLGDGRA